MRKYRRALGRALTLAGEMIAKGHVRKTRFRDHRGDVSEVDNAGAIYFHHYRCEGSRGRVIVGGVKPRARARKQNPRFYPTRSAARERI